MRLDAEYATWPEADGAAKQGRPAVLPFGALEQHGPHLPLSTDTVMAAELARRVADATEGWLLPAIPLGYTSGNDGFPGTVSLSFDTVRSVAVDVCRALQRQGFPCLIVVNGDFGNQAPLHQAARDVAAASAWPVLILDYPGLAEAAVQVCETEPAAPGFYHADEVETSVVLALRPDLVHLERATVAYPRMPDTLGATPIGLDRLSPSGVFGDPRPADTVKGQQLLELLTDRALAVVRAFLRERSAHADPVTGP
jgi:creatinine amidohydrolase